jgi:N6-L-threonylcarbamoyladenine synthase
MFCKARFFPWHFIPVQVIKLLFVPGVEGDELIPGVFNLCAGFQMAITRHLCQRLQRAMEFVTLQELLPPDNRTLVCRQSGNRLIYTEQSMNITS